MLPAAALASAVLLISAAPAARAQQTDAAADLVSSWLLVGAERDVASAEPRRVAGSRGLLVLDGAGNVFEFFHTPSVAPAQPDPRRIFADNGGFWGRYEAFPAEGRIDFAAEEGVSPSVRGLKLSRRYELTGDRLIITSTDEPQAQRDVRLTWQRVPTVENLSPAYREVVGFWRHVEESRLNTATGAVDNVRQRAPSVIVYTPSGLNADRRGSAGRAQLSRLLRLPRRVPGRGVPQHLGRR
jgi:hypothetical protein